MQNLRLAARYAKSLLDLAVESNSLDATLADMQMLESLCRMSREFTAMLASPVIKGDKKMAIISAVVKDSFSDLTKRFINLLVSKNRELNLPEIATSFISQYNELKHIKTVNVSTAVAMDDKTRNMIKAKVAEYMPGDTIQLKEKVDADLIGGFVLELDGRLYDASVKKRLSDIKATVVDNTYVSKL